MSKIPTKIEIGCCFCSEAIKHNDAILGISMVPENDPEAYQMWWAHPNCAKEAIHPKFRGEIREEIAVLCDKEDALTGGD